MRGDFERGWKEYETRWQCKEFNARNFKKPQWNGEALNGRRILLHAEQGFGDTFQFVRYARLVKEQRGGTVIVWCPKPLVPLVSQCPYVHEVTIEGAKLPAFDVHLSLLSLPHIFGTTLETAPSQVPYLFPKPELVEQWRDELSYIHTFRIGIGWQGNPRYRGDRHRSIPLEKFAPLAKVPGVRLISLQKGHGTEQIDKLGSKFSVTTLAAHRDETGGAFMDTAAILKNLDLVVSSDTSLVHLAGGLGVPIWVALPKAADWRWLLNRDDSPWYPTMRLFRQRELDNWEEVFQLMGDEVRKLLKGRPGCESLTTPILPEDLLDRIVLLEVRLGATCGGRNSSHLDSELARLQAACRGSLPQNDQFNELRQELTAIHQAIWNTEQAVRELQDNSGGGQLAPFLRALRESQENRFCKEERAGGYLQQGSYRHARPHRGQGHARW